MRVSGLLIVGVALGLELEVRVRCIGSTPIRHPMHSCAK
jgi:hypothetical protein